MRPFQAEVAAGIKLLDEKGPANWRDRINWAILDMYSIYNDILGQVYDSEEPPEGDMYGSGFSRGCAILFEHDAIKAEQHGFSPNPLYHAIHLLHEWHEQVVINPLKRELVSCILKRRAKLSHDSDNQAP